ncbi:ApaG [Brucella sp. BO2]|nr:ApaG [Brucella sp. BO2]
MLQPWNAEGGLMYSAVTRGIEVTVEPFYLEVQSEPEENRYVWGYRVTIVNNSSETVQLCSRYWRITNANGHVQEVRGSGVVGEQPILDPGDSYQYSSGCPLTTSSGVMVGRYQMKGEDGAQFEIEIPAFSLDVPEQRRTLN